MENVCTDYCLILIFNITDNRNARKQLYLTLIRSQMMYSSQLWCPFLLKDIKILEQIQRRATKFILNNYIISYKCRLIQLNLLPLMYQYELNNLLFFIKSYKASNTHFDINQFVHFRSSSTRSSAASKLVDQVSYSETLVSSKLSRKWFQRYQINRFLIVPGGRVMSIWGKAFHNLVILQKQKYQSVLLFIFVVAVVIVQTSPDPLPFFLVISFVI